METVSQRISMILSLVLLLAFSSAQAETLLDIYRLAKKNDLAFLAQIYAGDASAEIHEQAKSAFLPTLSAGYRYSHTIQDVRSAANDVYAVGANSFPVTEFSLDATQSILNYENIARLRQSRIELRKITADLQAAQQALLMKVVECYVNVLNARTERRNARIEANTFKRQWKLARNKPPALAASLQADAHLRTVENQYKSALRALEEMTGQPVISIQLLKPAIDIVRPKPAVPDEWVTLAQKNNPALLAQRERFGMSVEEVNARQATRLPTLDFVVSHDKKRTDRTLFGGGSKYNTTELALEVSLPLYNGGATSSKIRQAQHLRKKSQVELDLVLRQVKHQTMDAFDTVQSTIISIEALQNLVQVSQKDVKAKRAAAKSGEISNTQVLNALRTLSRAETDFANAKHNYLLDIVRLKGIVGILSEADLNAMAHHFMGDTAALQNR